eukprot:11404465-Heterocapsa_arctica.AAC.1
MGREERPHARSPASVRLQLYVDDPSAALRGATNGRDRQVASIVVLWRALGFPLAFQKALRGSQ